MDLRHSDDLDEGVGDTVEVEELRRGRIFLRLGGILFHLDLFDADANRVAVLRRNAIMAEQVYIAILRKRLYSMSEH